MKRGRSVIAVGALTIALLALAATPAVAATATAISATEGQAFSGTVDTVSCPSGTRVNSATIDWGDGLSSPGSVSGGFTVSGSHTYANGGTFTITVTIRDEGRATATPHDVAVVSGCSTSSPAAAPAFEPASSDLNGRY